MTGNIKLTAFNRQGSKSHVSEIGDDNFPKPRIKLIHPSGEIRYFFLEETTVEENPKFSVIIDDVRHYIGKSGWAIDFIFSSALNSLLNLKPNGYSFDVTNDAKYLGSVVGTEHYSGGVLASNGKIYFVPYNSTQILETDPEKREQTYFGNINGSNKYQGGVLAPDGKIYCTPYFNSNSNFLQIDPETKTVATFSIFSEFNGLYKTSGCVLGHDGKVYGIPLQIPNIVRIDLETKTVEKIGNFGEGHFKWFGGVLAPNGKIYCIPGYSPNIIEVDIENGTTTSFANIAGSNIKYQGGVLAPNGKIYCIPGYGKTSILEIDPETKTINEFGESITDLCGGVLAPNGKIYMAGFNMGIIEIDIEARTVIKFATQKNASYRGGVLAPNGKIYFVPSNSETLEIAVGEVTSNGLLSPYFNKL